ncbi:MAG: transglutaminase domain-containing protein, partial [Acutalibacteraceae bacterium]
TVSKQTGLANGQTAVWGTVDENFFNELAKDCTTQEDVVKKGYKWIIGNINYDYSRTYFMGYQHFNIEKTLETRTSICFDYSCLFASYCRSQGIPCFIIDGRDRNNSTLLHTWNRVYLGGSWWQVDTTFDSIQIKEQGQFYGFRRIENAYSQDEEYIITRIY